MVVSKIFIYAIMVIFLFPINFITPHDEFYKIQNGVSVQFHFYPADPDNDWDDIIIWMGSESTSIPLYYKNWESTYFPYSLNPSSCKTQIQADLSLWSNSVFGFTETQNITQGINIQHCKY